MSVDPLIGPVQPPALHVMTYNIRRRASGPFVRPADRLQARRPRLAALLRAEQPTLLGVQEALPDQAITVRDALGAQYRFVGHGRDAEGRGEGCPLFFDAERLELLGWRQLALSTRPETPGARSWGAPFPRVAVAATFRDRATDRRFFVVNTHLDVLSPWARRVGARVIRERVEAQPWPAIVTGDFNAGPGSAPLRELRSGGLVDAWVTADDRVTREWDTLTRYRHPHARGRRIDGIIVSPDVRVSRAAIDARQVDGGWPSDHLPVHAVVQLA
ncbi:endonuclease/exonuclease/phosphatase family protein [Microbacterium sp. MC2]